MRLREEILNEHYMDTACGNVSPDGCLDQIINKVLDAAAEAVGDMEECWDETDAVYIDDAIEAIQRLKEGK